MICTTCGAAMETDARFCPSCGAESVAKGDVRPTSPVGMGAQQLPPTGHAAYRGSPSAPWSYPTAPLAAGRVNRHLRPLSTLWLVYAGFRALGGVVGLLVVTAIGAGHFGPLPWLLGSPLPPYLHSQMWMGFAVPALIFSTLIASGLALATGLGLLQRWRGARILAMIAAVLALFRFPLGTALGIYTLWVLAPSQSGAEYDGIAASR